MLASENENYKRNLFLDNLTITGKAPSRRRPRSSSAKADVPLSDARLGQLIRVLQENAMLVLSGTKLGAEIGTRRSEVWRLVQQLRRLGVEIAGHPASGYQLTKVPDLLLADVLAPLLQGTRFSAVKHSFKVGSTNALAMSAAAGGAAEGTVFVAEEQTAGRGRGGHSWHSERSSGIYCSVVLRPQFPPADAILISLSAGLAVAAATAEVTGVSADLRWPNDVLARGKKFCGILTELNAEPTRVRHLVVGIGLNVNQASFPAEIARSATSLRIETGREWSRIGLMAALLKSLDREYALLLAEPRDSLLRRFEQASSSAREQRVHVDENGGYEGVTAGLDDRGFLRVRTPEGVRTVLSGGVRPLD